MSEMDRPAGTTEGEGTGTDEGMREGMAPTGEQERMAGAARADADAPSMGGNGQSGNGQGGEPPADGGGRAETGAAETTEKKQSAGVIEGYCVKCKESRTMQDAELTKTKNGRNMAKGKCPVCGTTMTKFLKG